MSDRPGSPAPGDDSELAYDRESSTGIPRWVKVSGIVVLLVALLVAVVMLISGGQHGPSLHGSGGIGGPEPPSSIAAAQVSPEGTHG